MTTRVASSAEGAGSSLDFYRELHRAFDSSIQLHAGHGRLIDTLMSRACESFSGTVSQQCAEEPPLACRRGCATCCSLRVAATAPEVLLIARFLRAIMPQLLDRDIDLEARIREVDAYTRGLSELQRTRLRQSCPFIARGVCVIYSVRPLACRGHTSHDVRACVDAAAGRRDDIPYSQGHRLVRALVQNAMQSSLRDQGLAWGLYELNHSVLLALDSDAEPAWLAGQDVFSAAALQEVAVADMADVYEALRPRESAPQGRRSPIR